MRIRFFLFPLLLVLIILIVLGAMMIGCDDEEKDDNNDVPVDYEFFSSENTQLEISLNETEYTQIPNNLSVHIKLKHIGEKPIKITYFVEMCTVNVTSPNGSSIETEPIPLLNWRAFTIFSPGDTIDTKKIFISDFWHFLSMDNYSRFCFFPSHFLNAVGDYRIHVNFYEIQSNIITLKKVE